MTSGDRNGGHRKGQGPLSLKVIIFQFFFSRIRWSGLGFHLVPFLFLPRASWLGLSAGGQGHLGGRPSAHQSVSQYPTTARHHWFRASVWSSLYPEMLGYCPSRGDAHVWKARSCTGSSPPGTSPSGRDSAQGTHLYIQVGLKSAVHNFTPQLVLSLNSSSGFLLKT